MIAAGLTAALVLLIGARWRITPTPRTPNLLGPPDDPTPRRVAPRRLHRRRAPGTDPAEVAAWCQRLASATRGGASLVGALRDVDPPPSRSAEVLAIRFRLERGAPLAHAIGEIDAHDPLAPALVVLRTCAELGGPSAEPLDRAAAALRDRAADRAEREVHSAAARASATVMTLLPVAMLVVLLVTSASVRGAVATPVGLTVVAAGAALNLAGRRWMTITIRRGMR